MKPVVRNITNDLFYFYLGNDEYENIITGTKGMVDEQKARTVFRFNIEATKIFNEFTDVVQMVRQLKLKSDGISGLPNER